MIVRNKLSGLTVTIHPVPGVDLYQAVGFEGYLARIVLENEWEEIDDLQVDLNLTGTGQQE